MDIKIRLSDDELEDAIIAYINVCKEIDTTDYKATVNVSAYNGTTVDLTPIVVEEPEPQPA